MAIVPPLPFPEARACVIRTVQAHRGTPPIETVPLVEAAGRILAASVVADRDSPALPRSMRDGFAVRSAATPGVFRIAGEVRAGQRFEGAVHAGEAIEIMTGAPVPAEFDAVVMIEHVTVEDGHVKVPGPIESGANVNPRASECREGDSVLEPGARLSYAGIGLCASVGAVEVRVFKRPRVAIVSTGDEIVEARETPAPHQIRNSNSWSLAAQVARAGGEPSVLPIARDTVEETAAVLREAFECDLVLVSGGVSAGKYDVVEPALAGFGAEFYFDRVLIQPGQPLVFGRARERFFFGLPGNPASTMVCFEVFARAALELLGGAADCPLPIAQAPLARDFRHKPGLTRFLPARLAPDGLLHPIAWSGSSDIAAQARANCLLVADPLKPEYKSGEPIGVLLR